MVILSHACVLVCVTVQFQTSSWQSWRFFSCGDLEPGLWTARLVPVRCFHFFIFLSSFILLFSVVNIPINTILGKAHISFLHSFASSLLFA